MRFLFLFVTLSFFLTSCMNSRHLVKNKNYLLTKISAATREKAKGYGNISLLDHQMIPLDYLQRNQDLKGLLINHYMGTGKTLLAIAFAQMYPTRPVIILAPKFLESQWMNELTRYGVADKNRFTFVSYSDAPQKLASLDIFEHILLVDEVHNLIRYMRSIDPDTNARYTEVYNNLRKAYKILGLTGTPIYGDESDIAFMINFVSGKNLMPFNREAFRLKYTSIVKGRQFFRGYFTESNLMVATLPMALGFFSAAIMGPIGFAVGMPIGVFLPVIINEIFDLNVYKLRRLNVEKIRPIMNKYISYFKFGEDHFKDFPKKDFRVEKVPYNREQYSFFLRLVEGDLPVFELERLLKDSPIKRSEEFIRINSTSIHEQIYSSVGAGRDIGNFSFFDKNNQRIEAPKFLRIFEQLQNNKEPTVIYSNYYHTGILALQDFLLRNNYSGRFAIIEPNLKMEKVNDIVAQYNNQKINLLLLHPEITEGISLKGTQYLHILEPTLNNTVLEQVIGRTRRFMSHKHLPPDKQKVYVRMWQSTSSMWNFELSDINRVNWFKRYRELNYMSRWGIGLAQIDKNLDKKALNPEELAMLKLKTIETNLLEMQNLLKKESIENHYETTQILSQSAGKHLATNLIN